MADNPAIISLPITDAPQKPNNPAVPDRQFSEQTKAPKAAFEAGATIWRDAHVRTPMATPTADPDRFARLQEGLPTLPRA